MSRYKKALKAVRTEHLENNQNNQGFYLTPWLD